MTKNMIFIVLLVAIFMILAGCQNGSPATLSQPDAIPTTSSESPPNGYPGPEIGYPGPEGRTPVKIEVDFEVEVVQPQAGKATVTGTVISARTNEPIPGLPVFLALVFENGTYVLNPAADPYSVTDNNGRYAFIDIEPLDYLLIVGNVEVGDYAIYSDANDTGLVWRAQPNEILDIGPFTVLLEAWQ